MSNFFKNPNANSVVVDRVPCAFAKADRNGNPGTHYTLVIFDKNSNVLYVGSECEHKHGEGIQALHELTAGNSKTCFSVTSTFRKALGVIKDDFKNRTYNEYSREHQAKKPRMNDCSPILSKAFDIAWESMTAQHNKRARQFEEDSAAAYVTRFPVFGKKALKYQLVADMLTSRIMNLPVRPDIGNHASRVSDHATSGVERLRLFEVGETTFNYAVTVPTASGESREFMPGTYLVLRPAVSSRIMAVRANDGKWYVDRVAVREYASDEHCFHSQEHGTFGRNISSSRCLFCNEVFQRMTKHTHGNKHVSRVLEVLGLLTKAMSPTGLRMLNNPRHKTTFFR